MAIDASYASRLLQDRESRKLDRMEMLRNRARLAKEMRTPRVAPGSFRTRAVFRARQAAAARVNEDAGEVAAR
jgi:hypothetical protein